MISTSCAAGEWAHGQTVDLARLIDRTPVSFRQGLVFVLCGLLTMVDGFDVQSIAFAAPEIARQWGLPSAMLGPVFSAGLMGGLIGGFVLGPLSDRYGPKRLLVISLILMGSMTMATAYAANLAQLLIIRALAGIGIGAAVPPIVTLLSGYAPARMRAKVVIVGMCGQVAGAAAGGVIAAQLMPVYGWQSVFILGGLLPLALLPVVSLFMPESLAYLATRPDGAARIRVILKTIDKIGYIAPGAHLVWADLSPTVSPKALLDDGRGLPSIFMALASLIGIAFFYFAANWLPVVLRDSGATSQQAVIGSIALNFGGALGAITGSLLVRRIGIFPLVIAGLAVGGVLLFALGLGPHSSLATLALIFGIGLFGFGALLSQIMVVLAIYPPNLHGTAVGMQLGLGRAGAIAAPLIGSLLLLAGFKPVQILQFPAICALAAALCILGVWRTRRSTTNRESETIPRLTAGLRHQARDMQGSGHG